MYKHIVAVAFVLTLVFASCDSPYAVRFQEEHKTYPPGEPRLAALVYPDISNRLSYGLYKSICPGKPLKSLEKAADLLINSQFAKNLASEYGVGSSSMAALGMVSDYVSQVISDSLYPEALGYGGTKEAMAAAVGTALSSNYSCSSIEPAAKLYYDYGRDDYIADVCHGKNSIKTLLALFRKQAPTAPLVAVSRGEEAPESFTDVYLRDPSVGEALRKGEVTREKALKLLVNGLSRYPLCHEVVKDYEVDLLRMAGQGDPHFFALYDAVLDFKRNCPLRFSGYVLDGIEGDHLIFSGDAGAPMLVVLKDDSGKYVAEVIPNTTLQPFSKPLPLKGEDVWVQDDSTAYSNGGATPLKFNYVMLIPLALIVVYGWERVKKN
jgi:hypothetical protein